MLSPRISALLDDLTPDAVERFWAEVTASGGPLIDTVDDATCLVTFVWRGETDSIRAWRNIDVPLTRIPGTDLWHGSEVYPSDLRTLYCLVKGDTRTMPASTDPSGAAVLDPVNPSTLHFPADPLDPTDSEGWASALELPGAPPSPWLVESPEAPAGKLEVAAFASASFGYAVTTTAYLPATTDRTDLPVVIVFDGYLGQTVMSIPTALDNLIAAGRIPPLAALFVRGRDEFRNRDLTPGPALDQMVAGELLPFARRTWNIGAPTGNVAAGMSRGGLAAAGLGVRRPDLFGAAIAHSGSFWWPSPDEGTPRRLIRDAARTASPGTRFFLDVGRMETAEFGGSPSQLSVCRDMRAALTARGCQVTYTEYSGGHDYVNWRHDFPEALIAVTAGDRS
jgi:enterochelin esterase-like enzyme